MCLLFAFCMAGLPFSKASAIGPRRHQPENRICREDTSFSAQIKAQLSDFKSESLMFYPKSVNRFYAQNQFQPVWIKTQKETGTTWQAMLLLDCVLQFGLSGDDYHPKEFDYLRLHDMLEKPGEVTTNEKARYEIMLTDAVITFMNHLHYGKLNPEFPASKIDGGIAHGFNADDALANAITQADFMRAVLSVQPKSQAYAGLQYHMHLLEGLYQGDCYEIPEATVRKIAINMERLRWADIDENENYVQVNIPSFMLKLHQAGKNDQFKVIVGKPESPTPALSSAIAYFTTAPEWRVPRKIFVKEILRKALKEPAYLENNHFAIYNNNGKYIEPNALALSLVGQNPGKYYARQSSGCDNSLGLIVFRFSNVYNIYLHDTPLPKLFEQSTRAFSHGCVRVEQAEKLADLLLKQDGSESAIPLVHKAMAAYKTRTFTLKKPVAIKITYLTCEMQKGALIDYSDIYNLDKSLEMALYNVKNPLTMK